MSGKRSKECLPSISILFVLLFLSILYLASCSIYVKNIYNFGWIENIGFVFDSPASYQVPSPSNYLSILFFNGPESYHKTTGIQANDVSVTLQQIAAAMYSVYYILEYHNSTTMQSISQLVLVSGNNPKSAPPLVWTLPEPIYIYTEEGKQSSPLFNTTRKISKMACLISCLMLTSDGKVFVQEYSVSSGMNSNWEERFILTNYINPNTYLPYENVTFVDIEVVGYVNCETFFGVTNYGHVFSYGCNQNEIRGVSGASANHYDTTMMDSLSNIVSISGSKGAYDSEMSSIGAIDNNGNLFTWGFNGNGALGLNETSVENSAHPTFVSLLPSTVKKVCFGLSYALVILGNDELYVFGDNRYQQCDPNVQDSAIWVPRKMSNFNSAVSDCHVMRKLSTGISDGNVYSWGDSSAENYGNSPYGSNFEKMNIGETVTKVALSNSNGIALTTQGVAHVWGNNPQGILSLGEERQIRYPTPLPQLNTTLRASIVSVGFGPDCSFLILKTEDGELSANNWGTCAGVARPTYGPEFADSFVSGSFSLNDVVEMEIGNKSAVAVLSNGDVYRWGSLADYSSDDPDLVPKYYYSNVDKFIMLGSKNQFILSKNGTVLGIGSNTKLVFGFGDNAPQNFSSFTMLNTSFLGNGERVVDLKGINDDTLILLTNMGNVYGCGNNGIEKYLSLDSKLEFGNFIRMNENIKVRKIVTGGYSSLVLISNKGEVYYVYGRPNKLVFPTNDSYIVSAYSQDSSYYYITKKGNIYTGGRNEFYQTSPKQYYSPPIANPELYPKYLFGEGIPYLIAVGPARVSVFTRDEFTCFGHNSTSESVCSSSGYCNAPDSCVCDEGYFGKECEMKNCFNSSRPLVVVSESNPSSIRPLFSDVFCKKINKLLR